MAPGLKTNFADAAEKLYGALDEFEAWHKANDLSYMHYMFNELFNSFVGTCRSHIETQFSNDGIDQIKIAASELIDNLDDNMRDRSGGGRKQYTLVSEKISYVKNLSISGNYKKSVRHILDMCFLLHDMDIEKEKKTHEDRLEVREFVDKSAQDISAGLAKFCGSDEERIALLSEIATRAFPAFGAVLNPASPSTHVQPVRQSELLSPPDGQIYATHAHEGEDVVGFIERVYGQRGYLTGEFTRADLRKVDPSAAVALNNWEKGNSVRPKGRAPLNLPTLAERNDELMAKSDADLNHVERAARSRLAAIRRQNAKRVEPK